MTRVTKLESRGDAGHLFCGPAHCTSPLSGMGSAVTIAGKEFLAHHTCYFFRSQENGRGLEQSKSMAGKIVDADSRENALETNSPAFYSTVGEIARSIGHNDFYQKLIELPALVLGCDRWLVVRYPRFGKPEIIFNNAMTQEALELSVVI